MNFKDIKFIVEAHTISSKTPEKRFRKWDKKTPYYIHPILCASLIMQEPKLPLDVRRKGSLTLLYHDVLEDTNAELPTWLDEEVKVLVKKLTFKNSKEKWLKIWREDKFIKLVALYDLVSNMLDYDWMSDELKQKYKEDLKRLSNEVEKEYGDLNIIKISKSLI